MEKKEISAASTSDDSTIIRILNIKRKIGKLEEEFFLFNYHKNNFKYNLYKNYNKSCYISKNDKQNKVRIHIYPYDISNSLTLAQNELFIHPDPHLLIFINFNKLKKIYFNCSELF